MTMPSQHLAECRRLAALERACPKSLPAVEDGESRARAFKSGRSHHVFFAEWSGPYPGVTVKNAPPRFVHLVVHAGDLERGFPFEWPKVETEVPDPLPKKRASPLLLDTVTWSGKKGMLVLAPSFPAGGIDGDHIIFRWNEGPDEYAVSIHAWRPLAESIQALKTVFASTSAIRSP